MSDKNGGSAPKPTIEELRADIEQTRTDLGETVQALAAKADVKARAKDQVEQTKQKVLAQAVEAGEKVRVATVAATDKVRAAAAQAGDKAAQAGEKVGPKVGVDDPQALVHRAREEVRASPVPLSLVFAGVAALVGVILIVRGRRR